MSKKDNIHSNKQEDIDNNDHKDDSGIISSPILPDGSGSVDEIGTGMSNLKIEPNSEQLSGKRTIRPTPKMAAYQQSRELSPRGLSLKSESGGSSRMGSRTTSPKPYSTKEKESLDNPAPVPYQDFQVGSYALEIDVVLAPITLPWQLPAAVTAAVAPSPVPAFTTTTSLAALAIAPPDPPVSPLAAPEPVTSADAPPPATDPVIAPDLDRRRLETFYCLSKLYSCTTAYEALGWIGPCIQPMSLDEIKNHRRRFRTGSGSLRASPKSQTKQQIDALLDSGILAPSIRVAPVKMDGLPTETFSNSTIWKLSGADFCKVVRVQINAEALKSDVLRLLDVSTADFGTMVAFRKALTTAAYHYHLIHGPASEVTQVQRLRRQTLRLLQGQLSSMIPRGDPNVVIACPQTQTFSARVEHQGKPTEVRGFTDALFLSSLDHVPPMNEKELVAMLASISAMEETKVFEGINRAAIGQVALELYAMRTIANDRNTRFAVLCDGLFNCLAVVAGKKNLVIVTEAADTDELATLYDIMALRMSADEVQRLLQLNATAAEEMPHEPSDSVGSPTGKQSPNPSGGDGRGHEGGGDGDIDGGENDGDTSGRGHQGGLMRRPPPGGGGSKSSGGMQSQLALQLENLDLHQYSAQGKEEKYFYYDNDDNDVDDEDADVYFDEQYYPDQYDEEIWHDYRIREPSNWRNDVGYGSDDDDDDDEIARLCSSNSLRVVDASG